MPGFPVHHQVPELTQTHIHQVSDAIQLPHPLSSLALLPSIFPSIRVFSNEPVLRIRWPKFWSFSFSMSSSNEYSGLMSFRMGWFDLLLPKGLSRVFSCTSLAPQFESTNCLVLSLLYSPILTSVHDYWKNHSFDYMDFCQQSDVSVS